MNALIEVTGLKKSYGPVEAVRGIDFYVESGTLFAFLGVNGAGKSTTIDIISTLLKPDAGDVLVDGHRLGREDADIRRSIGLVFQDSLLDPLLTVEENLLVRGSFYEKSRQRLKENVRRAAAAAKVEEFLKRPYGKLSGGQRRRADIARALVHTPKILILDEPTTGLDPQTRQAVWDTVRTLQKESGMTVFLTTHYMEEAAQADFITIMGHGEILAKGTPFALRERYSSDRLRLHTKSLEPLAQRLIELGQRPKLKNGALQVKLPTTMAALPLLQSCEELLDGFEVISGTMDDVFITVAGEGGQQHV